MINHKLTIKTNILQIILIIFTCIPFLLELKNAQRNPIIPYHAHIIILLYILLFLFLLPFIKVKLETSKLFILIMWTGLFLWSMTTSFWSLYPEFVIQRSFMIFIPSYILFIVTFYDKEPINTFFSILNYLSWFGAMLAFIGLLILIVGENVWVDGSRIGILKIGFFTIEQKLFGAPPLLRISSLTGNPNSLAATLMISLASTIALYFADIWGKTKSMFFFGIQFMALIFTFSRAGISVTIIVLCLLVVFSQKQLSSKIFKSILIILITGLLLGFTYIILPDSILGGLINRIAVGLNLRDQLWIPLISSVLESPLTGVGFGVSQEAVLQPEGFTQGAHNAHLAITSEIGILGYIVLCFLWIYGIIFSLRLNKTIEKKLRIAFITIGVLLFGFYIHQFVETSILRFSARHFVWVYLLGSAVSLYSKSCQKIN